MAKMITMTLEDYAELRSASITLTRLYECGVENWDGYAYAMYGDNIPLKEADNGKKAAILPDL